MLSCALSRGDSQKGKSGFATGKGFTVIEMMIAVGVLAILTALALPSYRMLIEKRHVTSAAEQVKAFLTSAQLEAVKRNEYVTVSFKWNPDYDASESDDFKFCLGFTTSGSEAANPTEAASCDCTLNAVDDPGAENLCTAGDGSDLKVFLSSNLSYQGSLVEASIADGDSIVYDPIRGFMAFPGDSMNLQFLSDDGHYALNSATTATGRTNVCSDLSRADSVVPGYDTC